MLFPHFNTFDDALTDITSIRIHAALGETDFSGVALDAFFQIWFYLHNSYISLFQLKFVFCILTPTKGFSFCFLEMVANVDDTLADIFLDEREPSEEELRVDELRSIILEDVCSSSLISGTL